MPAFFDRQPQKRFTVFAFAVSVFTYIPDAVELTDEMKDEFRASLLEDMRSEALNTALDQWMEEADIVYTEAGETWKLPEEEAEDEAEGETEEAAAVPDESADEAAEAADEEAANP